MKAYNHIRKIETDTRLLISYQDFDINFNCQFSADSTSNQCTIDLYNISKSSLAYLKNCKSLTIEAGYDGFSGYVFIGKVDGLTVEKEDGGDVVTKLQCTPDATSWNRNFISKSYAQRVSYAYVAEDIIKTAGWNVGNLSFLNRTDGVPYRYIGGKYFRKPARECLEEIAKDAGLVLHFSNNSVYMYPKNQLGYEAIVVSATDGSLIDSPTEEKSEEEDTKKYKIKTVLRYDYAEGRHIIVQGSDYIDESEYTIVSGSHVASDNEMYSELIIEQSKSTTFEVSNIYDSEHHVTGR
jgi:hypothetical protein